MPVNGNVTSRFDSCVGEDQCLHERIPTVTAASISWMSTLKSDLPVRS